MEIDEVKQEIKKAGYSIAGEKQLRNNSGIQLKINNGTVINWFNNGNIQYQGKNKEKIQSVIDKKIINSNSVNNKINKAKKYKIFGTGILLVAFIIQWTSLNKANENYMEWERANSFYSKTYRTGLMYQNLFFSAKQATGVSDGNILKKAAREVTIGLLGTIVVNNKILGKDNFKEDKEYKELNTQWLNVTDLDSFNKFIEKINSIESRKLEKTEKVLEKIKSLKLMSFWSYAFVYVIGTLCLLFGLYHEN